MCVYFIFSLSEEKNDFVYMNRGGEEEEEGKKREKSVTFLMVLM